MPPGDLSPDSATPPLSPPGAAGDFLLLRVPALSCRLPTESQQSLSPVQPLPCTESPLFKTLEAISTFLPGSSLARQNQWLTTSLPFSRGKVLVSGVQLARLRERQCRAMKGEGKDILMAFAQAHFYGFIRKRKGKYIYYLKSSYRSMRKSPPHFQGPMYSEGDGLSEYLLWSKQLKALPRVYP